MSAIKVSKRLALVNTFGTLGYISLLFQWCWSLLILTYPLIESGKLLPAPTPTPHPTNTMQVPEAFSPLMLLIAAFITVLVIAITFIAIARLPRAIGQSGAKLTHTAANKATTFVVPKPETPAAKRQRRRLSYGLVLLIKFLAIIMPLVALFFASQAILPMNIAWIIAGFCASWSVFYFTLQQLLAKLLRVKTDAIW